MLATSDFTIEDKRIHERYEVGQVIGSGAWSVVCLCKERGGERRQLVIKCVQKGRQRRRRSGMMDVQPDTAMLKAEVDVLKRLDHPNIVRLHDFLESETQLCLVLDYMAGGELFDMIVKLGTYTEEHACTVVRLVCDAVRYMHGQGIVHRDLKPENLLLRSADNITDVAIADFGLSKVMGHHRLARTAVGTPHFMAPEVLDYASPGYGELVDEWAIGVITYILLCGYPPFGGDDDVTVIESVRAGDVHFDEEDWRDISVEARDFVRRLMERDPARRMCARVALLHPWLSPSTPMDVFLTAFDESMAKAAAAAAAAQNTTSSSLGASARAALTASPQWSDSEEDEETNDTDDDAAYRVNAERALGSFRDPLASMFDRQLGLGGGGGGGLGLGLSALPPPRLLMTDSDSSVSSSPSLVSPVGSPAGRSTPLIGTQERLRAKRRRIKAKALGMNSIASSTADTVTSNAGSDARKSNSKSPRRTGKSSKKVSPSVSPTPVDDEKKEKEKAKATDEEKNWTTLANGEPSHGEQDNISVSPLKAAYSHLQDARLLERRGSGLYDNNRI